MQATYEKESAHLTSLGIVHEPFIGLDNSLFRLNPEDTFDVDRKGDKIGHKQVCACMSHYLMWKAALYCQGDAFWFLEYDAEFVPDWRPRYEQAMSVLPNDWDVLFLGSCCCQGLPTRHLGKNLYQVLYPLCGHALMIRKKALPVLLHHHQKVWGPLDIAMKMTSLPNLNSFVILPRIANQRATPLAP